MLKLKMFSKSHTDNTKLFLTMSHMCITRLLTMIAMHKISGFTMPDHARSRERVCSICWNRSLQKVDAVVKAGSKLEGGLINFVDEHYSALDPKQPSGLCISCKLRLLDWINEKGNPRNLQITTGIELGSLLEEGKSGKCPCYICWLASLFGPKLMKARAAFKQEKQAVVDGKISDLRRCNSCFGPVMRGDHEKHMCGGKIKLFQNLTEALPESTRLQFALYTLRTKQGGSGDSSFEVQSIEGGQPSTITLGKKKPPSSSQLTHTDVQTLATDAHLSGVQTLSVISNLRAVLGRPLVEPGLHTQLPVFNGRLSQFFTCQRERFQKGDTMVERPLFFCNDPVEYLKLVARLRGQNWEDLTLLVQGDSGPVVEKTHHLGPYRDLFLKKRGRKILRACGRHSFWLFCFLDQTPGSQDKIA